MKRDYGKRAEEGFPTLGAKQVTGPAIFFNFFARDLGYASALGFVNIKMVTGDSMHGAGVWLEIISLQSLGLPPCYSQQHLQATAI